MEVVDTLSGAARRSPMDALAEAFDSSWTRVWRAAYAVCGQRELASDAAQDAFLRAARSLHRLDGRPPEAWLVRVAVNRAIDLVRAQRRLVAEEDAPEPAAFPEPFGDDALRAALRRLDPERRAVVALHYWFDFTTPEIAQALGVPLGTVNSRLSRALAALRLELEADDA